MIKGNRRNFSSFNSRGHIYNNQKPPRLRYHFCLAAIFLLIVYLLIAGHRSALWKRKLLARGQDALKYLQGEDKPNCSELPLFSVGRIQSPQKAINIDAAGVIYPNLMTGGSYRPVGCKALEKTAIIIPYRNRAEHLELLLTVLLPMLVRQYLDFRIFVVEQVSKNKFNKGLLTNVGYLEALKLDSYDCFIFQDVDMVPLDDRNIYRCHPKGPIHLASSISKYNYSSMYEGYFGGVVTFTNQQYRLINGASNLYFGWGAEDDDLRDRVKNKNLTLFRRSSKYGVYDMLTHGKDEGSEKNKDRFKIYGKRLARQDYDGLSSIVYYLNSTILYQSYTWLGISCDQTLVEQSVPSQVRYANKDDLNFMKAEFVELD